MKGGADALRGNGVGLVRERALAARVQKGLERLYGLDGGPEVVDYMEAADEGDRETLLVREGNDGVFEVALKVPSLGERTFDMEDAAQLDRLCQLIEGVSHFVYFAHRAQGDRETTALEMEVQAEVDKYVILATSLGALNVRRSTRLRQRLYDAVRYAHEAHTELGERYRVANRAAHRFVHHLERRYVAGGRFPEMRAELRRFFHFGQSDKMHLGR